MVVQYPYILQILNTTESIQDEDGNWIEGNQAWINYSKCRDEDGNGKTVNGADGSQHVFSLLVQMPLGTTPLAPGDRIRIVNADTLQSERVPECEVIFSRKDQKHTRLWV